MVNLEKLYLQENRLTGEIPQSLSGARLSALYLDHNELHGPIPSTLGQQDGLRELFLNHNVGEWCKQDLSANNPWGCSAWLMSLFPFATAGRPHSSAETERDIPARIGRWAIFD
jgi:Leucine Rich Repeat